MSRKKLPKWVYALIIVLGAAILKILIDWMNKENASKLWKIIQEAGDYLVGQLPDHPNHPKGRNPYAHVAICVKSKFNASYKDIPDEDLGKVIKYIEYLKNNPSWLLLWKIIF